jgi:hypothetical protein
MLCVLASILVPATGLFAQEPDEPNCESLAEFSDTAAAFCEGFAMLNDTTDVPLDDLSDIEKQLESPETLNRVLLTHLDKRHGWQFLKDIKFQFKAFESSENDSTGLGFSYDYNKSFIGHDLACRHDGCVRGLDLSFSAVGNVAFDSDINPRDFLETRLNFAFFQSRGGVQRGGDELKSKIDDAIERFFDSEITDSEADEISEDVVALVRQTLTSQFYFSIAGDLALESDQQFDITQTVWSARGAIDFKDWSNQTAWTTYNIFDFPAAVIRAATGFDGCGSIPGTCFKPRGTAWPTLILGVGRVSPSSDDPRALAGDTSDFTRVDAEVSYRSPLARVGNDSLYLSANWRYYRELDPIQAVQDANLDRYSLLTLAIGRTQGVFISYSDGKLPFAFSDDQVFELGLKFRL